MPLLFKCGKPNPIGNVASQTRLSYRPIYATSSH